MNDFQRQLWETYREKIKVAQSEREQKQAESWIGSHYEILGVRLNPLSLRRLLYLEAISSPILQGQEASTDDLCTFLWVCSDSFEENPTEAKEFRKKFKIPSKKPEETGKKIGEEISEYLTDCFCFAQAGSSKGADSEHFVASVIDLVASEYSWGVDQIMDLPLPQLFQLVESIKKRLTIASGTKYIQFDPVTDALKNEYLQKLKETN